MSPLADRVRKLFEAHLRSSAELTAALLTGPEADAAPLEAVARRARAALGTGEARELLEEAISAGDLDPEAHATLLAHLSNVAEAEVLARRGLSLGRWADDTVVVNGSERRIGDLVRELRRHGRKDERSMLRALEQHFAEDREARREALAEAEERGARILARGPRGPDEAPDDTRERCARFLAETDDAAAELALRVRHAVGAEDRGLGGLLRALSPEPLDPVLATRTRARRLGSIIEALGLARELGSGVSTRSSRALSAEPQLVPGGGRITIFTGAVELGLASERAFLSALGQALARVLVSPMTALEHRHPPLGSASRTLGLVLADALATPALTTRLFGAGAREDRVLRTASSGCTLFGARLACARALVVDRSLRGDEEAEARAASALGCDPGDVSMEVALPLRQSTRRDLVDARACLAALAIVPALRERYDVDFHRNPRFADLVRGAAARGGLVSAEGLVGDAGGRLEDASLRALELAS